MPADLDGERADLIVARVAGISRAVAKQMLVDGAALAGGDPVAPRDRLSAGTPLELEVPEPAPLLEAEDIPLVVRHEDPHLVVVDKPAGMVVHPGAGRSNGTLAAGVLHRWPQVEGVGEEGRWGIVHRLDRDTSGLLVVALDGPSLAGLREALRRREITRRYLALVHGTGLPPTGTVDAPLARDPRHPTRFRVDRTGRPARTHYRVAARWTVAGRTLLEVRLETGRTHQIRVHAASIDHPVCGDPAYGRGGDGVARTWLHAAGLRFEHPVTGVEVAVASPLPGDLQAELDRMGEPDEGALPGEVL